MHNFSHRIIWPENFAQFLFFNCTISEGLSLSECLCPFLWVCKFFHVLGRPQRFFSLPPPKPQVGLFLSSIYTKSSYFLFLISAYVQPWYDEAIHGQSNGAGNALNLLFFLVRFTFKCKMLYMFNSLKAKNWLWDLSNIVCSVVGDSGELFIHRYIVFVTEHDV